MWFHAENLQAHEVMVFADTRDIHLLAKFGATWMPQGSPGEVMTPGKNVKHYPAGVLHLASGKTLYYVLDSCVLPFLMPI